ncbi:MAG TPA: HAD family phosphatase [Ignavibacteriaceae bacterium]|nr:HAD family phosphatase [Ignavibacteriaceae bacterium]
MIKAFVFDLDGTLVQTEILKAHSYAKAVIKLKPGKIKEHDVIEAYKKLVGHSREEVAKSLMNKFDLESESKKIMNSNDSSEPWQAFVKVRLDFYYESLKISRVLKRVECSYSKALLQKVNSQNFKTALATTSHLDEAKTVLQTLGLYNLFDFIATEDLVKKSKPDPEIYKLVLSKLNILPSEAIVIEDSLTGIKSALTAKTNCIAATNDYTRDTVIESKLLDEKWIVNDLNKLDGVVEEMVKAKS